MTESPLKKAALDFLHSTRLIERPANGDVADFMDGMPTKGLHVAMRSMAEAIGHYGDMSREDTALLDRLRQLCEKNPKDRFGQEIIDPYSPLDAVLKIAMPPEDAQPMQDRQALQDAFRHNGRPIFDEIIRILNDIAMDKKIEFEGNLDDMVGENRPDSPMKSKPDTGWRSSLTSDGPNVDDKSIRDSAKQHDANNPSVDDNAIRRSAAGGNEFHLGDDHKTVYERGEGKGDAAYLERLGSEEHELKSYYRIAKKLKTEYDKTLGRILEPAGVVPGKKQ